MKKVRRILGLLVAVAIGLAIYQAMQPQPIPVDLAQVTRGPLQVTVNEDGKTRIKERYVISAPLAGQLLRIDLDPGDRIEETTHAVATIQPTDPQLLNPRDLATAEARERAAAARVKRAEPVLVSAEAELRFAESELGRLRELREANAVSLNDLQDAERRFRVATQSYRAAAFAGDIAEFELEQARAALMPSRQGDQTHAAPTDWLCSVRSPIVGNVLRVFQESTAVVTPGTPLLEVGDPRDLELEIDVLSTDAVKIQPGNQVIVEHWGGTKELTGAVRLVEPSAFTKISALGVEEQRVNVIIDLVDPVEQRPTLGDGFRVEVRIVIWSGEDVLQVPTSALFRDGEQWLVFTREGDRAARRVVSLGQRNAREAEVLAGLQPGDEVIVHPSDQIIDQVQILPRE